MGQSADTQGANQPDHDGELDRPNPDQVLIEILLLARSGSSALIA
jgi:hypothetical protein